MFRCISELKGLVVDIDSFEGNIISWKQLFETYKCLFITSIETTETELISLYGEGSVVLVDFFRRFFMPNPSLQRDIVETLNLKPTEFAYISADKEFLNNAMCFLNGSIWITDETTYEEISNAPDLICSSIEELGFYLSNNIFGFFGESNLNPEPKSSGIIHCVEKKIDKTIFTLVVLGRYFGYSHYMNQLHPYSSAIYLNKKEGKKYYGIFNDKFAAIYSSTVRHLTRTYKIDAVLNVPVRIGKINRFSSIVQHIADDNNILNLSDNFSCISDYPSQKRLPADERHNNVKGVFKYTGDLSDQNVILIDDIISTGATIKECVDILMKSGALKVIVVVLAVNQKNGSYWKSTEPQVLCPSCTNKMLLLVNGTTGSFFYSCSKCWKGINYDLGRQSLIENVNTEGDVTL